MGGIWYYAAGSGGVYGCALYATSPRVYRSGVVRSGPRVFPRIVAASLAAFLTGSFLNSFVLAKLKIKTKGEKLWMRLIGSTFVGEFFETVVFALVAFGGILQGTGIYSN